MLIEDDETINFYNEFLLKDLGLTDHVVIAENGKAGLELLQQFKPEELPELIFLDINMPVMNGFEFMEEYEKLPEENRANALIIMLTTSMHDADRERARQFKSISDYVFKPLMEEKVQELVKQYF